MEGETGFLVPPSNSSALAEAICRVMEDVELSQKLGGAGLQRAKSFSYEGMVYGYEAVYRKVLGLAGGALKWEPYHQKDLTR